MRSGFLATWRTPTATLPRGLHGFPLRSLSPGSAPGRRATMPELDLQAFLAAAQVDPAVFALRPDYRALLLAVDVLDTSAPGNEASNALLAEAESAARAALK